MKRTGKILKLLLIILMVSLPVLLKAQPPIDDDVLDNPVPFDGGTVVLVTAAIAYGLKKANSKKKVNSI